MSTVLEIKHFYKTYKNGKKAVEDLNLSVQPGEIYGFIGQNGAGKTTTIRAVTGVMDFDKGEILIDGHSVKKEPVLCKSVTAYIPDNPDLYEFLTRNSISGIHGRYVSGRYRNKKAKDS